MKQRLIMRPNNHETNPDHIAIDFFMFFRTYFLQLILEPQNLLHSSLKSSFSFKVFGIWFYLTSSLSKPGINVFKICPVFLLKDLRVNESGFLLKNIANIRAKQYGLIGNVELGVIGVKISSRTLSVYLQ